MIVSAMNDVNKTMETEVTFSAADGFELAGTLLLPDQPQAAVLISSATGFPRDFYLPFARYGAARGTACFLYDYRGVGTSVPKSLKSFKTDFPDWGRLDMAAALDRLIAAAPGVPVIHIANSAGGHLVGFMPNHDKITRHVFIGVGFGTWWTHRFPKQQFLDLFFWWIYGPMKLAMKGYIPAGGLWGGSTLPDYRKQGLYTGLLAVRAREAQARGRRFLTVDASPMSRPILERFGFVTIAMATECVWQPGATQTVDE